MIPVTTFANKSVLVFGLGGSGLATAVALKAGGASVLAFDDNEARVLTANTEGIATQDLRDVDFTKFAALVLSPGVPLTHPEPHWSAVKAREAGIPIIGDVELFGLERAVHAPSSVFIAITGTNGKSTTAALIAHILAEAGRDVMLGGNIGRAVLTLDGLDDRKFYVVECSSYQIDLAPSLNPSIAVHLNISADHLDRHGDLDHYAAVKARLVMGAERAVIGVDDDLSKKIADKATANGVLLDRVSLTGTADITALGTEVFRGRDMVADVSGITSLRGDHNLQNAAIAYGTCRCAGLSDQEIRDGLRSFPGLPHRMEQVAQRGCVVFINDSKATNADAAAKALSSFDKIYWILGGLEKEGGIASLNEFFPKIIHAFLIGEAMDAFSVTLENDVPFTKCGTLDVAVAKACDMALEEKCEDLQSVAVLLSPACASWDQFKSFEARGDAFKEAIFAALK